MKTVRFKIKCWKCGREESYIETHRDTVVEVNLDKLCPVCSDSWMRRCEWMIEKSPFN